MRRNEPAFINISFSMKEAGKKHIKARFAAVLGIAVLLLYAVLSPPFFKERLGADPYGQWLQYKREPPLGIITVWHIVGVRPYIGSLGNRIDKCAREYQKRFIGVYYNVKAYTPEEARREMERGITPDIMSFPAGEYPEDMFLPRENESSPLPAAELFCLSKRVIAFDPSAFGDEGFSAAASSFGTEEEFKRGKVSACICDIRSAGNMLRAVQMGKMRYFELVPSDEAPLAQYLGIMKGIDPVKLPYAEGLIQRLLEDEMQSSLCGIGLFPASSKTAAEFDSDWLRKLYESLDRGLVPGPFD